MSLQEGIFLYKLASKLNEAAIVVEIGSWQGKSTVWLASALINKKNAKLYAVDPHKGSPEKSGEFGHVNTFDNFSQNISNAGVAKKVIPIKKKSAEAAREFSGKADLVFIDGSHLYEEVKSDFSLWKRRLKQSGWMIFHDATVLPGPWRVTRKYLLGSTDFIRLGMLGSMVFGQYCPGQNFLSVTFSRKLRNYLTYLFIISYVKMRKIPLTGKFKKRLSKLYFKKKIAEI